MSLSVVPHAVESTKHSVPVVEATVPSGECCVPSMPNVGKTRKYRLNLVKADWCTIVITTEKSDRVDKPV